MNNTLKIKGEKIDKFTEIVLELSEYTDMVNIQFLEEGMKIQTLDDSHTSMININIESDWFYEYNIENIEYIGIKISEIKKLLKLIDHNVVMEWEILDESVLIKCDNEKSKKCYKVLRYNIDQDDYGEIVMDDKNEYKWGMEEISIIKEMIDLGGENVNIKLDGDDMIMEMEGSHVGLKLEYKKGDRVDEKEYWEHEFKMGLFHLKRGLGRSKQEKMVSIKEGVGLRISEDYIIRYVGGRE